MGRKLALLALGLALGIGGYLFYQHVIAGAGPAAVAPTAPSRSVPQIAQTQGGRAKFGDKGVAHVYGGEESWLVVYNDYGEEKYAFRVGNWQPLNETGTLYSVRDPRARLHMPGGQVVNLEADEGRLEAELGPNNRPEPKSGLLWGRVHIYVDRAKTPGAKEPQTRPADIVHVHMDDLAFDLNQSTLKTDKDFRVQSDEATIQGRGLYIAWDELANRLVRLKVTEGKGIVLKTRGGLADAIVPDVDTDSDVIVAAGPDRAAVAAPKPSPTPRATEPPARAKDKDRRPQRYIADLRGKVRIARSIGDTVRREMNAEHVLALFEMTRSQQRAALGGETSTRPEAQTGPATQPQGADSYVQLTWTGPLDVRSVVDENEGLDASAWPELFKPSDQPAAAESGPHVVVLADGDVHLKDRRSNVYCQELGYNRTLQRAEFRGSKDKPVRMDMGPERTLQAQRVISELDPAAREGRIRLEGAGMLGQRSRGQASPLGLPLSGSVRAGLGDHQASIRWTQRVVLNIGQFEVAPGRYREFFRHADFFGDVVMKDQDQELSGQMIQLGFGKPDPAMTGLLSNLLLVEASGKVRLRTNDAQIMSQKLSIELLPDELGRSVPQSAAAEGGVEVTRGSYSMRADGAAQVWLAQMTPRSPQPEAASPDGGFERLRRGGLAVAAAAFGKPPRAAPRDSQEPKPEPPSVRVGLDRIVAAKNVVVTDPAQELRIEGGRVDATLSDGERIAAAVITADDAGKNAFVTTRDYWIEGRHISLDRDREIVDVPSAGRLRFRTTEGLDGRQLDNDSIVDAQWEGAMRLDGPTNLMTFDRGVRVSTEQEGKASDVFDWITRKQPSGHKDFLLECSDRLVIELEKVPVPPGELAGGFDLGRELQAGLISAVRTALGGKPKERAPKSALPADSLRGRKPIKLIATGDVLTESATRSPRVSAPLTRMTLCGAQLEADLVQRDLRVPGKGSLLLEDYRLQPPGGRLRGGTVDPLISRARTQGPSQTKFDWDGGLTYSLKDSPTAFFQKNVDMQHRTGDKIFRKEQIFGDPALREIMRKHEGRGSVAGLFCQTLSVRFGHTGKADRDRQDILTDPFENTEVVSFLAQDDVLLDREDKSIQCGKLRYFQANRQGKRERILEVEGPGGKPASITIKDRAARQLRWASLPYFKWNLDRDEAETAITFRQAPLDDREARP